MLFDSLLSPNVTGLMAAFLTTLAFVPQVLKTWRSRSADDVSFSMFTMFISGVFLWCIYGIEIHAKPVVIANVITFILSSIILGLKIYFERKPIKD